MSLSKKNLDKLNNYKNSRILNNVSNNISNDAKILKKDNSTKNSLKSKDPNEIFYSLIDNSESLEETCSVNQSLRKSELKQIKINSIKANNFKKLTTEEVMYDEFKYLLDE